MVWWEQGWLPPFLVHRGKGRDPLCCSHAGNTSSVGRWKEERIMCLHGPRIMLTVCAMAKIGVYWLHIAEVRKIEVGVKIVTLLKGTCSYVSITSQQPRLVLKWFQSSHPCYKIPRKNCSPSHEVLASWGRVVLHFCSARFYCWMKSIIPGWSCQSRHDFALYFMKFLKENKKEWWFLISLTKYVFIFY